jgi:hypothetical protein
MKNFTATIDILKISTCGKVSAPSDHTLTYNIGYDTADKTLLVRLSDNDTGGLFSNEWITLDDIVTTIENAPAPTQASTRRYSLPCINHKVPTTPGSWPQPLKRKTY